MLAAASVAALAAFLSGLSPDAPMQADPPPPVVIDIELVSFEAEPEIEPRVVEIDRPSLLAAEPSIETAPLMARKIAWCESRWDGRAKNPNSSASGYFQFIDSTWESVTGLPAPARDYPYSVQLEAWETLWDEGRGAHHWSPSEHCWAQERPWD